jgi:hypothetical protein
VKISFCFPELPPPETISFSFLNEQRFAFVLISGEAIRGIDLHPYADKLVIDNLQGEKYVIPF